jgi:preprotein translocase subunit SecA
MPEIDPDINEFLKSLEGKDIDEILANIPEIPGEEQFENKDMDEIMKELEAQTNALKAEFEAKQRKKVKRNEPCPCGSGKKYKDCCGKSPKF